jgi:hypothetical protein
MLELASHWYGTVLAERAGRAMVDIVLIPRSGVGRRDQRWYPKERNEYRTRSSFFFFETEFEDRSSNGCTVASIFFIFT